LDIEDGICTAARIALGGVDSVPVRVEAAESLLEGVPATAESFRAAAHAAAAAIDPGSDIHGDANYRRGLARVLIERACAEAVAG
jgi:carbon-monoxide dehydrogenase medium subunit